MQTEKSTQQAHFVFQPSPTELQKDMELECQPPASSLATPSQGIT